MFLAGFEPRVFCLQLQCTNQHATMPRCRNWFLVHIYTAIQSLSLALAQALTICGASRGTQTGFLAFVEPAEARRSAS